VAAFLDSAGSASDPVMGSLFRLEAGGWCLESWVLKKGWVVKESEEGVRRKENSALQCPIRSTKLVT